MDFPGRTLTSEGRRRRAEILASQGQLVVAKGQDLAGLDQGEEPPWHCHLCNKLNAASLRKCQVCGRPRKWTVARGNPLHGLGVGSMRKEQIKSVVRRKNIDPNEGVEDDWTPLHFAAYEGNVEMVEALIEQGALTEAVNNKGWTALHFAVSQNHLPAVHALVTSGANVDATTKWEQSAGLHLATEEGFIEVMKVLLLNNCNPNARNLLGRTALHLAAEHGDIPAAQVLMAAGAYMDILDNDGWLPIQIAEVKGFQTFIRFLDSKDQKSGGKVSNLLKTQSSDPYDPGVLSRQLSRQSSKSSTQAGREIKLQGLPKEWHTEEWHNVMHDMELARNRIQKEIDLKQRTQDEVELYHYRRKAGFDLDARIRQTKREGYLQDLELMKERMQMKANRLTNSAENHDGPENIEESSSLQGVDHAENKNVDYGQNQAQPSPNMQTIPWTTL